MELDLQSLFGFLVTWCTLLYSLAETPQLPPHLGSHTRALLVSQGRRHLFVTPRNKHGPNIVIWSMEKTAWWKEKDETSPKNETKQHIWTLISKRTTHTEASHGSRRNEPIYRGPGFLAAVSEYIRTLLVVCMDERTIKTPNPKCLPWP